MLSIHLSCEEIIADLNSVSPTSAISFLACFRSFSIAATGVPFPFECLWAGEVRDCSRIESLIHNAFRHNRVNPKREFFNIEPDQVIPLLQELAINELTLDVGKALRQGITKEEQEAPKQFHRPMLNFEEMNIPIGSTLVYVKNSDITSTVTGIKKVTFEDVEFSLTALTRKLLDLPYNVAPCRYWTFEGKNLQDIYDETYTIAEV